VSRAAPIAATPHPNLGARQPRAMRGTGAPGKCRPNGTLPRLSALRVDAPHHATAGRNFRPRRLPVCPGSVLRTLAPLTGIRCENNVDRVSLLYGCHASASYGPAAVTSGGRSHQNVHPSNWPLSLFIWNVTVLLTPSASAIGDGQVILLPFTVTERFQFPGFTSSSLAVHQGSLGMAG
jgi:hypothetical protein